MPAEPVPLRGSVKGFAVANTMPETLVGGVEQGQEFGVEVPEDRPHQGLATSG